MKVFVSSIMRGFQDYRQAARKAIKLLEHEPVMAEDFGARPESAPRACLGEVALSDVLVLVLGAKYSGDPAQDPSVTEQEYDEAISLSKPILAFAAKMDMEPRQRQFLKKVEARVTRDQFDTPESLKDAIVTAIHKLSRKAAPPRSASEAQAAFGSARSQIDRQINETMVSLASIPVDASIALSAGRIGSSSFPEEIAGKLMSSTYGFFDLKYGFEGAICGDGILVSQSGQYGSMEAYAYVCQSGPLLLGKTLREQETSDWQARFDSSFAIDEVQVRKFLIQFAGSTFETYRSVYKYTGQIYVQAGIVKMGSKTFGQRPTAEGHGGTLYMGTGADPAYVPSSPSAQSLPRTRKEQIALADEFTKEFRWLFKKDGRLMKG